MMDKIQVLDRLYHTIKTEKVVYPKIIQAPEWLKTIMDRLRRLPKPTLEQIKIQFKSSAEFRKRTK